MKMIYNQNLTNKLKKLAKLVDKEIEYDYAMEAKTYFILYRKANKKKNFKITTFKIEKDTYDLSKQGKI